MIAGSKQKYFKYIILTTGIVLATGFLFLRFFQLEADFPLGITWSGTLFTDEGWYANAAVRHYKYSDWYLAGDFNPIINMPVGQLLFRPAFSAWGLGFASGRCVAAGLFIGISFMVARLVFKRFGITSAILVLLLLATNYISFAYSRLMLLEFPALFFVVSGIFILGVDEHKSNIGKLLLGSFCVGLGILTKTSMIFIVPVFAYLAWWHGRFQSKTFLYLCVGGVGMGLLPILHYFIGQILFKEDFLYFKQLNFGDRNHENILVWVKNLPELIVGVKVLGKPLVVLTGLVTIAALCTSARFRKDILVHMMIGYSCIYIALLSGVSYGPPRYYLPFIVPITILCAGAAVECMRCAKTKGLKISAYVVLLCVGGSACLQSGRIIEYISHLQFTFVEMARETGDIIRQQQGDNADNIFVLGHIADTVAIETGIRALNTELRLKPLSWLIETYRPEYFLMHTDEQALDDITTLGGKVYVVASWDVYENYYREGQNVQLMSIKWPVK